MEFRVKTILKGAALAAALIAASFIPQAKADGAQTITRDRFSDEIVGHGPDIVFIPGLASSRDTWKATAARLQGRYRVHLIEVAGFAGEPARANASGPVLVPTAEAIGAYLVEQHLAPATIIGHSLGGTMALYLVEKHRADIKKAMLVDALPFYATLMRGPTATVDMMKPIADGIRAKPADIMSGPGYEKMLTGFAMSQANQDTIRQWGKQSDPNVVANAVADDLILDLRPDLGAIRTPVTLLYPDYAPVHAPKGTMDATYQADYAANKNIKLVPITNSLHFIMLDQPAQFAAALDAFLAQSP
jgi:pimeloyl-[acyl-carrier protein] methyl ester esterase